MSLRFWFKEIIIGGIHVLLRGFNALTIEQGYLDL